MAVSLVGIPATFVRNLGISNTFVRSPQNYEGWQLVKPLNAGHVEAIPCRLCSFVDVKCWRRLWIFGFVPFNLRILDIQIVSMNSQWNIIISSIKPANHAQSYVILYFCQPSRNYRAPNSTRSTFYCKRHNAKHTHSRAIIRLEAATADASN